MYRDRFGTDWDQLDRSEAIERAFALGVAAALGRPLPEEFHRIRTVGRSAYDRTLIELSYNEGIRAVNHYDRSEADSHEEVWEELVSDADPAVLTEVARGERNGLPGSLHGRPQTRQIIDHLKPIRLPSFLRRP